MAEDYFCRKMLFRNAGWRAIAPRLHAHDRRLFHTDCTDVQLQEFMGTCLKAWLCCRKYILGESLDDLDYAKSRMKW